MLCICVTGNALQLAQVDAVSLYRAFLASVLHLMINREHHVGNLGMRKQILCVTHEERLQSLVSATVVLK